MAPQSCKSGEVGSPFQEGGLEQVLGQADEEVAQQEKGEGQAVGGMGHPDGGTEASHLECPSVGAGCTLHPDATCHGVALTEWAGPGQGRPQQTELAGRMSLC